MLKHSISEGLWFFGEGMEAIHSIEYQNLTSCFYLFGVKYHDIWLSWQDVEDFAFLSDIPTVPVVYDGIFKTENELKDFMEYEAEQNSLLGGEREGLVIRVAGEFKDEYFSTHLQKMVRKNHVRTDEHWQKNWKKANIKY